MISHALLMAVGIIAMSEENIRRHQPQYLINKFICLAAMSTMLYAQLHNFISLAEISTTFYALVHRQYDKWQTKTEFIYQSNPSALPEMGEPSLSVQSCQCATDHEEEAKIRQ